MRALILLSLLFISDAWALKCKDFERAAQMLDPKEFLKVSSARMEEVAKLKAEREKMKRKRKEKLTPQEKDAEDKLERVLYKQEIEVNVGDINQAKTMAYRFPALEEFGFGRPGNAGWKPYTGDMEVSKLYGKHVGYETKTKDGRTARIRLDWDEEKGGHYNISFDQGGDTHKIAVSFLCNGRKCDENEIAKMASNMQK